MAIGSWSQWAEEHSYPMELDDSARAVFVYRANRGSVAAQRKRIDGALEFADEKLYPLERDGEPARRALHSATVVLVQTKGDDEYASVFDKIIQDDPRLGGFISPDTNPIGVVVPSPLCAIVREDPLKKAEWEGDPDNELINRLAQLVLLHEDEQPTYWWRMGWSWNVELAACGTIFCFPHRNGFVGVGEHLGWDKILRAEFRSRSTKKELLTMAELSDWKPGTFRDLTAGIAWGTVRFIIEKHPDKLTEIAGALSALRVEKGVVWLTPSTWESIPGFQLSAEDQLAVLTKHLGPDVLEDLAAYFRGL
jgi:hypothetical protein